MGRRSLREPGVAVGRGVGVRRGRRRGGWRRRGEPERSTGDGDAGVVVDQHDLGGGLAGQAAGLRAPLVQLPAVRVGAARLARGCRRCSRSRRSCRSSARGSTRWRRPRRPRCVGRPGRVVDLVAASCRRVEALAVGVHVAAPVQHLVPGVVLHGQRARSQRLGRPGADPLARQHVLRVGAEVDRLDGAGGVRGRRGSWAADRSASVQLEHDAAAAGAAAGRAGRRQSAMSAARQQATAGTCVGTSGPRPYGRTSTAPTNPPKVRAPVRPSDGPAAGSVRSRAPRRAQGTSSRGTPCHARLSRSPADVRVAVEGGQAR